MKFIRLHLADYDRNEQYIKGREIYFGIDHIVDFQRNPREHNETYNFTHVGTVLTTKGYHKIWETPEEINSLLGE